MLRPLLLTSDLWPSGDVAYSDRSDPCRRGYYKCSSVRGCPARKHVERAPDDPSMVIVTYEGEHRHALNPMAISTDGVVVDPPNQGGSSFRGGPF